MKVGIDVSQIVFGTGVSDYTVSLFEHLPHEIMVPIGFSSRRQNDIKHLIPTAKTFPIPPSLLHPLWNKFHQLPVEFFTGPINVFHSSDWTQPPSKAKKVTTVHDLAPFLYPDQTLPQVVAVHTARMHWVVKECDAIICVSENTRSDMQKLFPQTSSRLVVIPEALPTKSKLIANKSPYDNYLLAMGSRQKRKNIPRLISAYQKYKSKFNLPDKLIITGENILTSADPGVIFTGYISDQELVNLMAGAQAFIYPSLYEGFGLPVLVAFYHRVPVVCSNTSSLPEVAGKAAILVDPLSEKSLAEGILTAITQKDKLVQEGLKQLTKFSWEITAQKTLEVYKSLC